MPSKIMIKAFEIDCKTPKKKKKNTGLMLRNKGLFLPKQYIHKYITEELKNDWVFSLNEANEVYKLWLTCMGRNFLETYA